MIQYVSLTPVPIPMPIQLVSENQVVPIVDINLIFLSFFILINLFCLVGFSIYVVHYFKHHKEENIKFMDKLSDEKSPWFFLPMSFLLCNGTALLLIILMSIARLIM